MEQVFKIWPSLAALGRDLGENETTVRSWKRRNSIPAKHDMALIKGAKALGCDLTFEHLAKIRSGNPVDIAHDDAKCNAAAE